jgi:outer membrane protein assembly factor BamD (BamD/ComL family)
LEVWKQIEGNNAIAFIMQKREDFKMADEAKQSAITREVEQIIINYPNSTYTKYLKSGIDKFKANADKQKQPE